MAISTLEHKARRFQQISILERELSIKSAEIRNAKAHAKELSDEYDGLLTRLRTAARDEGDLSLLDLMEEIAAGGSVSAATHN